MNVFSSFIGWWESVARPWTATGKYLWIYQNCICFLTSLRSFMVQRLTKIVRVKNGTNLAQTEWYLALFFVQIPTRLPPQSQGMPSEANFLLFFFFETVIKLAPNENKTEHRQNECVVFCVRTIQQAIATINLFCIPFHSKNGIFNKKEWAHMRNLNLCTKEQQTEKNEKSVHCWIWKRYSNKATSTADSHYPNTMWSREHVHYSRGNVFLSFFTRFSTVKPTRKRTKIIRYSYTQTRA